MAVARTFSGEHLRELRSRKNLTQHDLASKLRIRGFGTTQTTVSRWEDGQQPNASVLPALAESLGVDLGDLFSIESSSDDEEDDPVSALCRNVAKTIVAFQANPPKVRSVA